MGHSNDGWAIRQISGTADSGGPQMRRATLLVVVLWGVTSSAAAQNWIDYLNGTFHRPTMAVDELGNALPPLLLYKDTTVEMYIPDFTGTDESQTRPALFKRSGQYEFVLYMYMIDTHKTNRSFIVGNTESGEIHVHTMDATGGLFGPVIDYHHNKGLSHRLDQTILAYMKLMVYLHSTETR
jgi:hypothetical protein